MDRRIVVLAAALIGMLAAVGGLYGRLMLGERQRILRQSYANAPTQVTVERLMATGVIAAKGETVTLDESRLAAEVPSKKMQVQVRSVLPFIRAKADGGLELDRRALEVRYQPNPAGEARGMIWDRHGEVLAGSVKDPKTQKSRREYPLGPAAFHLVGTNHPAFGTRGIEAAYRDEMVRGRGLTLTLSADCLLYTSPSPRD